MATTTAAKKSAAKPKEPEPEEQVAEDAGDTRAAEAERAREETEAALNTLVPKADPKEWIIGKPPEKGGTEDEFSRYVQRPLSYMARMRFFSLVSNTIADAIKAGGTVNFGGADLFSGGSLRSRASQLTTDDFADAGSFMALAMQLIGYAPDFLLECYCLWLDVPASEKQWAKLVMEQRWEPDANKWGLSDDAGFEIIEVFIDQNYDDIREFFTGKLPRLVQRVRERETQNKQARESESVPSKQ